MQKLFSIIALLILFLVPWNCWAISTDVITYECQFGEYEIVAASPAKMRVTQLLHGKPDVSSYYLLFDDPYRWLLSVGGIAREINTGEVVTLKPNHKIEVLDMAEFLQKRGYPDFSKITFIDTGQLKTVAGIEGVICEIGIGDRKIQSVMTQDSRVAMGSRGIIYMLEDVHTLMGHVSYLGLFMDEVVNKGLDKPYGILEHGDIKLTDVRKWNASEKFFTLPANIIIIDIDEMLGAQPQQPAN